MWKLFSVLYLPATKVFQCLCKPLYLGLLVYGHILWGIQAQNKYTFVYLYAFKFWFNYILLLFIWGWRIEIAFYSFNQAGLELSHPGCNPGWPWIHCNPLPQPTKCWDYRHEPLCLIIFNICFLSFKTIILKVIFKVSIQSNVFHRGISTASVAVLFLFIPSLTSQPHFPSPSCGSPPSPHPMVSPFCNQRTYSISFLIPPSPQDRLLKSCVPLLVSWPLYIWMHTYSNPQPMNERKQNMLFFWVWVISLKIMISGSI